MLRDFEFAEVGDVPSPPPFGQDTLSWAHRGAARVVGLDFSEPAVEAARDLAAELGYASDRAAFVAADVYDAAEAVPDAAYDIVYTDIGRPELAPGPGTLGRHRGIPKPTSQERPAGSRSPG